MTSVKGTWKESISVLEGSLESVKGTWKGVGDTLHCNNVDIEYKQFDLVRRITVV